MTLVTEPCVNCNLHTPVTNWYCIHCGKNRLLKTTPKSEVALVEPIDDWFHSEDSSGEGPPRRRYVN